MAQLELPARSLVCYASGTLHEVLPVRSGERLALVGWLQSMVRDAGRRELLFALRVTTDALAQRDEVEHEVTTLSLLYGGCCAAGHPIAAAIFAAYRVERRDDACA